MSITTKQYLCVGVMMVDGQTIKVTEKLLAENEHDAKRYFEMSCEKKGAELHQLHEVSFTEITHWHKYQINKFQDTWDIHRNGNEKVFLVGQGIVTEELANFTCYALENGLIGEPLPLEEQYPIN